MIDKVEQMEAYSEAVKSGLYNKRSGLVGKYDNVRRYWEEETTRHFIYPYLKKLIARVSKSLVPLRILDLGCGSADGFELLTGIRDRDASLNQVEINLLTPEIIGMYKGVDLNEDLIKQARAIYSDNPKMVFEQADFCKGLPVGKDEKPFDLYFSSYGTCSHHNHDETMINLLVKIAKRTEDYCLVICDWIGRYSYEWQTLWTNDLQEIQNMDYVVSYIYEKEEREARRDELQHLTLRLMSRQEAEAIVAEASREAGVTIKPLKFIDRSIFTGRHMDTAEYNPYAQPIRAAVNSLHETNIRTDLRSLIVNYIPKKGFDFINNYFQHLQACWNTLVNYVDMLLNTYDDEQLCFTKEPPPIPATFPPFLKQTMGQMKRVIESVGWFEQGLPRENTIEPQLGYALRTLMRGLQQGRGCAHGLVGVLEIDKRASKA